VVFCVFCERVLLFFVNTPNFFIVVYIVYKTHSASVSNADVVVGPLALRIFIRRIQSRCLLLASANARLVASSASTIHGNGTIANDLTVK